jgi:preprotein translocase subunit YajC
MFETEIVLINLLFALFLLLIIYFLIRLQHAYNKKLREQAEKREAREKYVFWKMYRGEKLRKKKKQ